MGPLRTSAFAVDDPQHIFEDIQGQFLLGPESLTVLVQSFLDEMKEGLSGYKHPMAMIPTFVKGVPDGTETGTFLALDLGGTNLRVCEVELHGNKTFTLRQQKYKISEKLKTGEATALFDFLADSVDAFLTSPAHVDTSPSANLNTDILSLGLTFSFPAESRALDSGILLTWTKGFSARGAAGNDVVKLLQDAFDRKHMHVKCVALVNDTVGTMLTQAYTAGGCILGAIFGTGTNGAYVEEVANITKLAKSHPEETKIGGYMVVNTEWGGFNNSRSHLPSTAFDNTLDRLSINPGFQAMEKFISGMYLGEITRLILVSLIDASTYSPSGKMKPLLFGGKGNEVMNKEWGVDTQYMSEVEDAWGEEDDELPQFSSFDVNKLDEKKRARLERVRKVVINRFGYKDAEVGAWDAAVVRWACKLVAHRAAHLSGVAIAAILVQTGRAVLGGGGKPKNAAEKQIAIGVDGSLIEHYPHYERTLRESLRGLVGKEVESRVVIGLAKDGSGVGAALCALQALKQKKLRS